MLQLTADNFLCHTVAKGGDAEHTATTVGFGNTHFLDCRGHVAATGKPIPQRVKVFARVGVDNFSANSIYTSIVATATTNVFPRSPDSLFADRLSSCLSVKNHPYFFFSFSCYTILRPLREALRYCLLSQTINTTTASSATDKYISTFDLAVFACLCLFD